MDKSEKMKLPTPPVNRIVTEFYTGPICSVCGSSMHDLGNYLVSKYTDKCINHDCENYYKK